MATYYYFMKDPDDGKPMLVNDCPKGKKIHYRSYDYNDSPPPKYGSTPPKFDLIFKNPKNAALPLGAFIESIDTGKSSAFVTTGAGVNCIATFTSSPGSSGGKDFQEVYVEFKSGSQPNVGFRYEVDMAGKKMDPRVRPR